MIAIDLRRMHRLITTKWDSRHEMLQSCCFLDRLLSPARGDGDAAEAKLFDWTLTGPSTTPGGVPYPGSGTFTATETSSPGVWDINVITGTLDDGSSITGPTTFHGADNLLYTNGFAFLDTSGMSFEAEGPSFNVYSFFSQGTPPTGNAYGQIVSIPPPAGSASGRSR